MVRKVGELRQDIRKLLRVNHIRGSVSDSVSNLLLLVGSLRAISEKMVAVLVELFEAQAARFHASFPFCELAILVAIWFCPSASIIVRMRHGWQILMHDAACFRFVATVGIFVWIRLDKCSLVDC